MPYFELWKDYSEVMPPEYCENNMYSMPSESDLATVMSERCKWSVSRKQ